MGHKCQTIQNDSDLFVIVTTKPIKMWNVNVYEYVNGQVNVNVYVDGNDNVTFNANGNVDVDGNVNVDVNTLSLPFSLATSLLLSSPWSLSLQSWLSLLLLLW